MHSKTRAFALLAAAILALAAVGPGARYIEEIAIGGGFGDPIDGGAEIDRTGAIASDGPIEARGNAAFGHTDGPHAVSVTAGPGAEAGLTLNENDALNGARLWYDGAANALNIGTHNNHATPTPALQIEQGSADVEVMGGLNFASGPSLSFSGSNLLVSVPTANHMRFHEGATERYRMSSSSFHSRNGEDLGLISRPWGEIYGANMYLADSLEVSGGLADIGTSASSRAVLELKHGGGGNTPATIALNSPNGTTWYVFVEDDGTLKISSSIPDENSDGSIVGSQF